MSIVVTGATGKVGRYLVARLRDREADHLAASRHAEGDSTTRFDWNDEATWPAVIEAATRVWIVPQAAGAYDVSETVGRFIDRCLERGQVEQFGVLSVRNAEKLNRDIPSLKVERALAESGVPWFSLRPTWFYQNLQGGMFAEGIRSRHAVLAPTGDGRVSFIDADDIAACAEVALLSPVGTVAGIKELSGPESLTFADLAAALTTALGTPIRHADVSDAEMTEYLVGLGLVPTHVSALLNHFARIRAGGSGGIEYGVHEVTGRPATTFAEHLVREADAIARLQPVA